MLETELESAGDDAAVVGDLVITTDMLHERTDFPAGTAHYTAGWRAVGASLSDVAAMGAQATAAVAVYAAPAFDAEDLLAFVRGASDVCETVGAAYVGGDLDDHTELTVATTAIGHLETDPVLRSGATPGEVVCVTGTLGRSAAALDLFARGDLERANTLFRFEPRVAAGRALAAHAGAMMDSSDGLARSLHQLSEASGCGFAIESARLPVDDALLETAEDEAAALETATTFGEDFELVFTLPEAAVTDLAADLDVPISVVGEVREAGEITLDGEALADEGYTH
ncbi:thiamine-phosphate kinase [Natronobiforma cellulositropha]